ncbi:hypothetical protein [Rhodanobacter sp. BL-MT-08]
MKGVFLCALAILITATFAAYGDTKTARPVRGVTFFYLDSATEDFPWVLAHQRDPIVRARIDALLAQYRSAGVNWIRLLVSYDYFSRAEVEPAPSRALIKQVNDFIGITHSGPNAGQFHVEVVLTTHRDVHGLYSDVAPYAHDKRWLQSWIDHLDYTNLGMIMLAGDLSPCYLSGCYGDRTQVQALPMNHGAWITSIWAWKQSRLPKLAASYEVIGVQSLSNNDPALISKLATWMDVHTPTNPVTAVSLYVSLPAGSTWQDYAKATNVILDTYAAASTKPLWIDEYGKSVGIQWTTQDQRAAFEGFLTASLCQRQNPYAAFAWVGGRDYPYKSGEWFGLVDSFRGSTPVMMPAWKDLAHFYTIAGCS